MYTEVWTRARTYVWSASVPRSQSTRRPPTRPLCTFLPIRA